MPAASKSRLIAMLVRALSSDLKPRKGRPPKGMTLGELSQLGIKLQPGRKRRLCRITPRDIAALKNLQATELAETGVRPTQKALLRAWVQWKYPGLGERELQRRAGTYNIRFSEAKGRVQQKSDAATLLTKYWRVPTDK
jgi:hypothetical protein